MVHGARGEGRRAAARRGGRAPKSRRLASRGRMARIAPHAARWRERAANVLRPVRSGDGGRGSRSLGIERVLAGAELERAAAAEVALDAADGRLEDLADLAAELRRTAAAIAAA